MKEVCAEKKWARGRVKLDVLLNVLAQAEGWLRTRIVTARNDQHGHVAWKRVPRLVLCWDSPGIADS